MIFHFLSVQEGKRSLGIHFFFRNWENLMENRRITLVLESALWEA